MCKNSTKIFLTNIPKTEDGMQNFWKERFIAGLSKLFEESILSKLRQLCGSNHIPFQNLTYGMIFGVVKSERLILCNELKIHAKYGSEKAHSRQGMGTFYEAWIY